MTKEKREHGQSRVATYWYGLQARSLRFCIALLLVMTVHAIVLEYVSRSATDDFTIYLFNTEGLLLWWFIGAFVFAVIYATYRTRAGLAAVVLCLLYFVVWFGLGIGLLHHTPRDIAQLDDRVYYLESGWQWGSSLLTIGNDGQSCCVTREYVLYECDSIGLICHVVYADDVRDTYNPSGYLHVNTDSHTFAIIVFDEIMYAYPEGDS